MEKRTRLYRRNVREKVLRKRTTTRWNQEVHDVIHGESWIILRRKHPLYYCLEWTSVHEKVFRRKFYILEGRAGYHWNDKGNSKKNNHKCGDCPSVRNKDSGCDWHYTRTVRKNNIFKREALEDLYEIGYKSSLAHRNRGICSLRK